MATVCTDTSPTSWLNCSSSSESVVTIDDPAKEEEELAQSCEIRTPQLELDPRIPLLDPDADDFPLLRFGFVLPHAKLAELVQKKNLEVYSFMSTAVARYLWLRCGDLALKPFTIVCPLSTSKEYLISLWSTQDLCKRRKVKASRQRRALDILRKELELGDQPAMWYWDFACGPGYICPLNEYNPRSAST